MTTPPVATTALERLAALGLTLPTPPSPAAAYQSFVRTGSLIYVSGQISTRNGELVATGRLGDDVDEETGFAAAQASGLNVLAQLNAAAGSLEGIAKIVKLTIFIASAPGFNRQSQVANGASQLLIDVLGPAGEHARSAVGVAELPADSPVEVEAIAELKARP
jgi:enamine deaminase RidA (YjgF/YER057c/UK114 family)